MSAKHTLIIHPVSKPGHYQQVTALQAGWEYLNFEARYMKQGEIWEGYTGENEYGFILLSGNYSAATSLGSWETINGRKSVFDGIAHTLYLPRHCHYSITAESEWLDIAAGWCRAEADYPAKFRLPDEAVIEIRGGDNATRQINSLIEPGFGADKIVAVEVYTPSGNWSSFPPHKHDERKIDENGKLLEADLEEFYFFKIDKPNGFAYQHVYNDDFTLDELMRVSDSDIVMVPSGYHPVVAGQGYNCYYLNFLAGSDQSLANTPDPKHEWIFNSWKGKDTRVPMVNSSMNNGNKFL